MESTPQKPSGDRFIRDGMNGFERNVKRCGDCLLAAIALRLFVGGDCLDHFLALVSGLLPCREA